MLKKIELLIQLRALLEKNKANMPEVVFITNEVDDEINFLQFIIDCWVRTILL